MKTDARTQYTKKVIRECFFALLKEKPLNKITVKSICEQAQINRTTFYRYYSDPFDLLDQIMEDLFATVQRHIRELRLMAPEQALEIMLNITISNEEFYTILASDDTDHLYVNRMVDKSYADFEDGFCRRYPNLSPQQRKWLYHYMAHGCISVILDWIRTGMQESPKEMAAFMARLDDVLLKNLLPQVISN